MYLFYQKMKVIRSLSNIDVTLTGVLFLLNGVLSISIYSQINPALHSDQAYSKYIHFEIAKLMDTFEASSKGFNIFRELNDKNCFGKLEAAVEQFENSSHNCKL